MMVGCCFVSVAICFFAAIIAKMKKSGHLSLVNMYRYALLLFTSGFERVADFMRFYQRRLVRGASILAAIFLIAVATFTWIALGMTIALMMVLGVLFAAGIAVMISRAMKSSNFNLATTSQFLGFNSLAIGSAGALPGSTGSFSFTITDDKMDHRTQRSLRHGQTNTPSDEHGHVNSQTSSSSASTVSGAGFKTHDDT